MFSFVGETVLDPFAGSGTTSLAAKHLGRNSIGYEINKEFQPIMKEKILELQTTLFDEGCRVVFIEDHSKDFSFDTLPYLFNDPHKMDKKVNIKKLQFGSKIDSSGGKRAELFGVSKVLSPEKIELSNGLIVKLLGIKENPQYTQQAVKFLQDKLQKRKVLLKYDSVKYDTSNTLVCYIYLDNKTFINNHLIRTGFVSVDTDMEYSLKTKFLKSLPA